MEPDSHLRSPSLRVPSDRPRRLSLCGQKRSLSVGLLGESFKSPRLVAFDAPSQASSGTVASDESRTPSDRQWAQQLQPLKLNDDADSWTQTPDFTPSLLGTPDENQAESNLEQVCFGVVTAIATSSFQDNIDQDTAVSIRSNGDILQLYTSDSDKYAGLLNFPPMSKILSDFSVDLSANLTAMSKNVHQTSSKDKIKQRTNQSLPHRQRSVRIVLRGRKIDGDGIAHLLSDDNYFFETPSRAECGMQIEYHNPQYLLRPRAKMPCLDDILQNCDTNTDSIERDLGEIQKSQLLRILDTGFQLKVPLETVTPSCIRPILKKHQLDAFAFMMEKEMGVIDQPKFPPLWEVKVESDSTKSYQNVITRHTVQSPTPIYGGILADEMGLGKTLSSLSLICATLESTALRAKIFEEGFLHTSLIIAPLSIIPNWTGQIQSKDLMGPRALDLNIAASSARIPLTDEGISHRHIHEDQLKVQVYHGDRRQQASREMDNSDIILTTYDTLRLDWQAGGPLHQKKWYRIILDEAHHIRNRSTKSFRAACAIKSRNRWCLTGTPIHNSLDNYGALVEFLGIPPIATKSSFDYWILQPFQKAESWSLDRIRSLIQSTCLRRIKAAVAGSCQLVPRSEQVHYLNFSSEDQELYDFFRERTRLIASKTLLPELRSERSESRAEGNILSSMNFLRLICDHGEHLLPTSATAAWRSRDSSSVTWAMMQNSRRRCSECQTEISLGTSTPIQRLRESIAPMLCELCSLNIEGTIEEQHSVMGRHDVSTEAPADPVLPSIKLVTLLQNLSREQDLTLAASGYGTNKSVIFTYWTTMLQLVDRYLRANGFSPQQITGQMSLNQREKALVEFRQNTRCTVLLATISSAGEGIDLTVANSVHILEPHWNPMVESQAVDRVHRIGQEKEVFVHRYIISGSIEEYVQSVQAEKLDLIKNSIGRYSGSTSGTHIMKQRLLSTSETTEVSPW